MDELLMSWKGRWFQSPIPIQCTPLTLLNGNEIPYAPMNVRENNGARCRLQ